ncbi:unnamed protein product [Alopecurus aequalis]
MQGNRVHPLLLAVLLLAASVSPTAGAPPLTFTRRLEDDMAPELGWAAGLHGTRGISESGLNPNREVCLPNCVSRPGEPYTRGCKYKDGCPTTLQ